MATITVAADATRKGIECSGGPGRLAWTTRCHRVMPARRSRLPGPGPVSTDRGRRRPRPDRPGTGATARARRRPRSTRSRTSRTASALGLQGGEHHRSAPGQIAGERGHDPLRLRLGRLRIGGQDEVDDDRVVGLALRLPHHQRPDVRGGRPVDRPPGVARLVGADAPGLADAGRRPAAAHRRRRRRPACRAGPARPAGAPRGAGGAGRPRRPGPTTAVRTARRRPARRRPRRAPRGGRA